MASWRQDSSGKGVRSVGKVDADQENWPNVGPPLSSTLPLPPPPPSGVDEPHGNDKKQFDGKEHEKKETAAKEANAVEPAPKSLRQEVLMARNPRRINLERKNKVQEKVDKNHIN